MCGDTIQSKHSQMGYRLPTLLQQFVWIALLQGRPQDLPSGQAPLRVAMLVNLFTYVIAVASTRSISDSLVLALADIVISGLCLYIAVSITDKRPRFYQAYTALCGGTAVLNVVAVPVLWVSAATGPAEVGIVDLLIVLWGLAIIAHVLRHTLEVSPLISVGLALAFYMMVLQLLAITGVISSEPNTEQQLSIYLSLSADWLSKA